MASSPIQEFSNAQDLQALIPKLCQLSAGTEMSSYKEAQWNFLVAGGDVTAYGYLDDDQLLGCVLKIRLDETNRGYGMMLVSPHARGQGLARKLLTAAMIESGGGGRNILAVCTELGQPFYRKLDFRNIGRVSFLSGSAGEVGAMKMTQTEQEEISVTVYSGVEMDRDIKESFIEMDAKATGFDRRGRLSFLMTGKAGYRVSVGVVKHKESSLSKEDTVGMAILRQDVPDGPVVIGPILVHARKTMNGRRAGAALQVVPPLIQSLVESQIDLSNEATISMLLAGDHPDLVSRLIDGASLTKGMELPAMAQDDMPIYKQQDGIEYVGLIHPTLG